MNVLLFQCQTYRNISEKYSKGLSTTYSENLLSEVKKEIRKLNVDVNAFCNSEIVKLYNETQQKELLSLNIDRRRTSTKFAQINKQAVEALAEELRQSLLTINNAIMGSTRDIITSINLEGSIERITTDTKKAEVFKETINALVAKGVDVFVDSAGRQSACHSSAEPG
jgi:soluble P-type ATPase